jgi:hypothetical protein
MTKGERLDYKVLQESQNYKDQLDKLDIKTLWKELDKLIPPDKEN